MDFLEKDLGDIIWQNLKHKSGTTMLNKRGLRVFHPPAAINYRELNLFEYGFADIVQSVHSDRIGEAQINLFELKRGKAGAAEICQLLRYKTGLKRLISLINPELNCYIESTLVCRSFETNKDDVYLLNELQGNVSVVQYEYKIDGLFFTPLSSGLWNLVDEHKMTAFASSFDGSNIQLDQIPGRADG